MPAAKETKTTGVKKLEVEVKDLQKKLKEAKKQRDNARTRRTEIIDRLVLATIELEAKKKEREKKEKLCKIRCQQCGIAYGSRAGLMPKLLTCGHTVCEACARMLKQECPFDGQTVRSSLIVNQGILEHNALIRVAVVTID